MEYIMEIANFLANKVIMLTLLPSLFINVVIDIIDEIISYNRKAMNHKLTFIGFLCFLGIINGFVYYFYLNLQLDDCILHSLAIVSLSYFFYKIDIYDFFRKLLHLKYKKEKKEIDNE